MRTTTSEKICDMAGAGRARCPTGDVGWPLHAGVGDFETGGLLMVADRVENYLGIVEGATGPDLADGMEEQAHRHCLGTDREDQCSSGE